MTLLLPLYLAGLLGLLLPWLLHRFSHQRPIKLPFPSIRFLEATKPPVSREKKLRYRWLLALRALFLVGLCLLFAEPLLNRLSSPGTDKRLHVVAIDQSFSMRAADRWADAMKGARDYLARLQPEASVRILGFDQSVTELTDDVVTANEALSVLTTLAPGYVRADYGNIMQRINTLAARSKLPTVATVFTDAQQSSLPVRGNALSANDVQTLNIVDVSQPDDNNVSVQAEALTTDGVFARIVVSVLGSLQSDSDVSDTAVLEREVVVAHLDKELARENIQILPGEAARVVFDGVPLPAVPDIHLDVSLEQADSLAEDNAVTVVVRDSAPIDIAVRVMDSANDSSRLADARVYVQTAIELDGKARLVDRPGAGSELPADVRHAVVFADMSDANLPAAIPRFVENGGGVLVINAPPATLNDASGTQAGEAMGKVDPVHALGLGQIDWRGVQFYQPANIELRANDTVLLATVSGAPILVERRLRGGLLLLLADSLTGVQSNLPLQPAYVELMRRIVDYLDGSNALPESLLAGSALSLPANVQLLSPSGDALLALADTAESQSVRLTTPGIYDVVGISGNRSVRVVVDPLESNLMPITSAELAAWQQRAGGATTDDSESSEAAGDDQTANNEVAEGFALWRILLPLVVLLLLGESIVGNRRLNVRRDGS